MNQRDFDMMQLEAQTSVNKLVTEFYTQWFARGQVRPGQEDEFVQAPAQAPEQPIEQVLSANPASAAPSIGDIYG